MLSVPNRTLLYASQYDVTVMSFRSGSGFSSKNGLILEYYLNIHSKSVTAELKSPSFCSFMWSAVSLPKKKKLLVYITAWAIWQLNFVWASTDIANWETCALKWVCCLLWTALTKLLRRRWWVMYAHTHTYTHFLLSKLFSSSVQRTSTTGACCSQKHSKQTDIQEHFILITTVDCPRILGYQLPMWWAIGGTQR